LLHFFAQALDDSWHLAGRAEGAGFWRKTWSFKGWTVFGATFGATFLAGTLGHLSHILGKPFGLIMKSGGMQMFDRLLQMSEALGTLVAFHAGTLRAFQLLHLPCDLVQLPLDGPYFFVLACRPGPL
jgi:hypothetical protein